MRISLSETRLISHNFPGAFLPALATNLKYLSAHLLANDLDNAVGSRHGGPAKLIENAQGGEVLESLLVLLESLQRLGASGERLAIIRLNVQGVRAVLDHVLVHLQVLESGRSILEELGQLLFVCLWAQLDRLRVALDGIRKITILKEFVSCKQRTSKKGYQRYIIAIGNSKKTIIITNSNNNSFFTITITIV